MASSRCLVSGEPTNRQYPPGPARSPPDLVALVAMAGLLRGRRLGEPLLPQDCTSDVVRPAPLPTRVCAAPLIQARYWDTVGLFAAAA